MISNPVQSEINTLNTLGTTDWCTPFMNMKVYGVC
jgi:hypothetical protein